MIKSVDVWQRFVCLHVLFYVWIFVLFSLALQSGILFCNWVPSFWWRYLFGEHSLSFLFFSYMARFRFYFLTLSHDTLLLFFFISFFYLLQSSFQINIRSYMSVTSTLSHRRQATPTSVVQVVHRASEPQAACAASCLFTSIPHEY